MKIINYKYTDNIWEFQKVDFQSINLIVGDSGTGKTRLLNTIFNLGSNVANSNIRGASSKWEITIGVGEDEYYWEVGMGKEAERAIVDNERLTINGNLVLERDKSNLLFKGEHSIKLPNNSMSISILREESEIKPIYDGFTRILRRSFFRDEIEKNSGYQAVNKNLLEKIGESGDLFRLYEADFNLNLRLYILHKYFKEKYKKIVDIYLEAFDFIESIEIIPSDKLDGFEVPLSSTPVFCFRERNVKKVIRLDELSSGMQKALLIITDLLALPDDFIYLIDEYENSLGIGAINILPDVLLSNNIAKQIFITSHHPYIISKFPIENWYVAHRKGSKVSFSYGDKLVARYNLSKQDKYFQLVNDPFYIEGIE